MLQKSTFLGWGEVGELQKWRFGVYNLEYQYCSLIGHTKLLTSTRNANSPFSQRFVPVDLEILRRDVHELKVCALEHFTPTIINDG